MRPSPVTMLTTPGGSSACRSTSAEEQRGQRRRLGGLEHDGVARGERGRDLPREHQQREVPRDDLAGDADRPRPAVRERVLELVGPARVVEEVRGRERQVDVARLLDRLAAVERLEHGELARALLEDARDAEEVLRALRRRDRRPAVLECVARRRDGAPRRPPAIAWPTSASGSSSPARSSCRSPPARATRRRRSVRSARRG